MRRSAAIGLVIAFAAFFLSQARSDASGKSNAAVTFSKDVAPILYAKCATCHRTGEMAPMSLLTYKEVRPWAKSIRKKVLSREMPPWYADPNHGEFINDRRLSQKEMDTILAWVDGGSKEGEAKDLPPQPKFPITRGRSARPTPSSRCQWKPLSRRTARCRIGISSCIPNSPRTSWSSLPRSSAAIRRSCITSS